MSSIPPLTGITEILSPPKYQYEDSPIPTLKSLAAWSIFQRNTLQDISEDLEEKTPKDVKRYVEIFSSYMSHEIVGKFENDPEFFFSDYKDIDDNMFLDLIKNAFIRKKFTSEQALLKLLFISAEEGFILSMKYILQESLSRGFDIVNEIISEQTPLMMAALNGNLDEIKELISSGATVDLQDINGKTALCSAVLNGHLEALKELIRLGATVDLQDSFGKTALFWAAMDGDLEAIKELKAGATIDLQDMYGKTALFHAATMERTEAIKELRRLGATIDLQDNHGHTALFEAAYYGHTGTVKELIRLGATIDLQDNHGHTALFEAAHYGHTGTVKELIKAGATVNQQDNSGITALFLASLHGKTETVKELKKARATVNLLTFKITLATGHYRSALALIQPNVSMRSRACLNIAIPVILALGSSFFLYRQNSRLFRSRDILKQFEKDS